MKPRENWSSGFREEDIKRFHGFISVYITGARADNPQGGKILIVTKTFYYFNHTL